MLRNHRSRSVTSLPPTLQGETPSKRYRPIRLTLPARANLPGQGLTNSMPQYSNCQLPSCLSPDPAGRDGDHVLSCPARSVRAQEKRRKAREISCRLVFTGGPSIKTTDCCSAPAAVNRELKKQSQFPAVWLNGRQTTVNSKSPSSLAARILRCLENASVSAARSVLSGGLSLCLVRVLRRSV